MNIHSIIIEDLEKTGILKTMQLKSEDSSNGIIVAFPDEYDEEIEGPFHFLSDVNLNNYIEQYNKCKSR